MRRRMAQKPAELSIPREPDECRALGRICVKRIVARLKREVPERKIIRELDRAISRKTLWRIKNDPDARLSLRTYKKLIRAIHPAPPKKKKRVVPFSANKGWHYGDCL